MRAGQRDRRVEVLRADLVDTGYGTEPGEPAVLLAVWAERADVSDGERFANGIEAAEITARFRVLACDATRGIRPSDRLRCEGREFDVVGVKEIEGRTGLEITVRARADA